MVRPVETEQEVHGAAGNSPRAGARSCPGRGGARPGPGSGSRTSSSSPPPAPPVCCRTATTSCGPTATFALFCLVSAGTYFVNDAIDAASDRHHPTKRLRPVAAGELTARRRRRWAGVAQVGAIGLAWALAGWRLARGRRRLRGAVDRPTRPASNTLPVIELACVSSGFVVRAIAGGMATGVPLVGLVPHRHLLRLAVGGGGQAQRRAGRPAARTAPPPARPGLVSARLPALGAADRRLGHPERLLPVGLRACPTDRSTTHHPHPLWFELSIVPVVLAVLHLELQFESGHGEAPEELALRDRLLQGLGLVWVVLFAIGVYMTF
jgi:decaprenyl-phosphate phosphoribosyltransferase